MASAQTVRGTVATAINTGGISQLLGGLVNARVKVMLDQVTLTTDYDSGSTIIIGGVLPVGANVVAIILAASAAQASLTASVGDSGSTTRYASAHTGLQTAVVPVVIGGKNYVVATAGSDDQIRITTGGAAATAGTLYAAVLFTTD